MALRIAGIIFLAILLAACPKDSAHSDPRVGRAIAPISVAGAGDDAATTGSRTLSAALEFVRWDMREGRLYVDFLLKNESEGEILVWERWNSWGQYTWTIELRNEARDSIAFGGWQTVWTEDYGSAQAIEPGEVFRMKSYLQMKDRDGSFDVSEGERFEPRSLNAVPFAHGSHFLYGYSTPEDRPKWDAFFTGSKYELRGNYGNTNTAGAEM